MLSSAAQKLWIHGRPAMPFARVEESTLRRNSGCWARQQHLADLPPVVQAPRALQKACLGSWPTLKPRNAACCLQHFIHLFTEG